MAYEYQPIPRLAVGVYPLTNVTPFTYRDGVTYEKLLHQLIDRMNTIIGEVNTNNQALFDVVIENMNIAIDAVNEALGNQTEYVDEQFLIISGMVTAVEEAKNDAEAAADSAEFWAANTETLQDAAVSALLDDSDSLSHGTALLNFSTGIIVHTVEQLQEAISNNTGQRIYVKSGVYETPTLTTGTSLDMVLEEDAIIKLVGNTTLLHVTGAESVSIVGGVFDGDKSENTVTNPGTALLVLDAENINIQTSVVDAPSTALRVENSSSSKIDFEYTDVLGHGVHLVDSENAHVHVNGLRVWRAGVLVSPLTKDVHNIHLTGTVREAGLLGNPHCAIYFNSGDDYAVKDSSDLTHVYDAGYVGKFMGGDDLTVGGLVDGAGLVSAPSAQALWIHDASRVSTVPGLVLKNSARNGLLVNKSHSVIVTGVRAEHNGNAGIQLSRDDADQGRYRGDETNKDVVVSACSVIGNSVDAANAWPGIRVDGYENVSLINNMATDYADPKTQSFGILSVANVKTTNLIVIGNTCIGNIAASGINVPASHLSARYANVPNSQSVFYLQDTQLTADATEGFMNIPRILGEPTGTPTMYPGSSPLAFAPSQNRLYVYTGTMWRYVELVELA